MGSTLIKELVSVSRSSLQKLMVNQFSSLLVVTLLVRELATEAQTVTIGRVRSIRPTHSAVSTSASTAVALTLSTTTAVTSASAFVAFSNDFIIIKEYIKYPKNNKTRRQNVFGLFCLKLEWEVIIIHIC